MNKSSGVLIRKAKPQDLEAMVEIWWQLVAEHEERDPGYWGLLPKEEARSRSREWRSGNLDDPERIHLVAEIQGRVVGFVHGQPLERPPIYRIERIGRIHEVAVQEGFRGRGVGKAMVFALVEEFRRRGFVWIDLMVDQDNEGARTLYGSLGFYPRELHMMKMA